jgi:hypothetical protein
MQKTTTAAISHGAQFPSFEFAEMLADGARLQ